MRHMFFEASSFNGDLSSWDVSSVRNMRQMFDEASSFNGDLSAWDVSSVTDMAYMFRGASSFNGDLSSWDVSSVENMQTMFDGTNLSDEINVLSILPGSLTIIGSMIGHPCQLCPPSNLAGSPTYNSVSLSWGAPGGCENYVIDELPYYDRGSNASATDDWPVSGSDDKDIAYKITFTQTTTLDISTCNADTDFDTKLSIFDGRWSRDFLY